MTSLLGSGDDAEKLPPNTTPTWEMELIISGAAVFAMAQFPGWTAQHLLPLVPRFTANLGNALRVLFTYLDAAAVVLAITFAVHLILRMRWISLLGIDSVFPDGVLWQRLRLGPISRQSIRRHDRGATAVIERADNRSTIVFAFGVMLGLALMALGLTMAVAIGIALVFHLAGGGDVNPILVFAAILAVCVLPFGMASALDRAIGHRLRPGHLPQHVLARVFEAYARIGNVRRYSVARVLESHMGRRRYMLLTFVVIWPVLAGVSVALNNWGAPRPFGSYAHFPQMDIQDARVLSAAHYGDERDLMHDPAVPFIQSDVVTGPYLKLTVPYAPARDGGMVRHDCPQAQAPRDRHARFTAALACLTSLHTLSLDGKPLASVHYDVASDPRTRRPALQAMLDIRNLAAGRHVLRVARAGPATAHGDARDDPWIITFWH